MGININTLEKWVKETKFGNEKIQLDQCTTIINQRKFADSSIAILKANKGKITFLPYYQRLKKFYLITKNQKL